MTAKSEILSLCNDLGETAIDSLLADGLFKDIPFIGSGITVSKLIKSASDRILLTKMIHFLNDLNLKNQNEIDMFKCKYFKDKDYKKIGSKLLLVLERADNETKIKWLAKSLRYYVGRELNREQFLRLSTIINSAYSKDVLQISAFDKRAEITSQNDLIDTCTLDHLFSIGLLESHGFDCGDEADVNSGTIYALNDFGKIMKEKII